MATLLSKTKSTTGSPYVYYKLNYTANRDSTNTSSLIIKVTGEANLASSQSTLGSGYTLTGYLQIPNYSTYSISIKGSGGWSGTTTHSFSKTITLTNVPVSDTTISGIKFRVLRENGTTNKAGYLSWTNCQNINFEIGHNPPTINSITMQEVNPALVQAGITNAYNDYFVLGLSQKQFTINANYEDDARYDHTTIYNYYTTRGMYDSFKIDNINVLNTTNNILDTSTTEIKTYYEIVLTSNVRLSYEVYDSMGGSAKYQYNTYYPFEYNYQTYTPITLTASVKRVGQTTGNVKITASGTYYNETIGNENHSGTYKPTLIYKYWEAGQDETQATIVTIPSSNITTSNGTYNCEYQISGFDYEKAYRFKVAVQDTLVNNSSMWFSSATSNELSIALGKALWTEYKDRVDFAKLTINRQNVLVPYELYYNSSGTNGSIVLSETSANFEYIEVFYENDESSTNEFYLSTRVFAPNGKGVKLQEAYDNGTYLYFEVVRYTISGTNLTRQNGARWRFGTSGNNTRTALTTSNQNLKIYKVVGYK